MVCGVVYVGQVIVFSEGLRASFTFTLLCALALPVMFYANYMLNMNVPSMKRETDKERLLSRDPTGLATSPLTLSLPGDSSSTDEEERRKEEDVVRITQGHTARPNGDSAKREGCEDVDEDLSVAAAVMTIQQRLASTLSLWPYMVPLFVVYFAEYAMQSGVWAAMGFPITSENARDDFYEYSNWMYQAGVLVSRSSGTVWKADMSALWAMPVLQMGLLLFFLLNAYYQLWYDWSILTLCFVVGLFGGAVRIPLTSVYVMGILAA